MDRQKCRLIAQEAEIALRAIAAKHGVEIKYNGGNFTPTSATLKFEFAERATDGTVLTEEASNFKRYAEIYGLKADDLGREFWLNGKRFTISGLNTRAHKMPVIAKASDGKSYKFSATSVVNRLKAA